MTEWDRGSEETRKSLADGNGITFPNAKEAIKWLKSPEMTEQELREKLEQIILRQNPNYNYLGRAVDRIFALIKEAGYTRQPEIGPYEIPHAAVDKYFTPPEPNPSNMKTCDGCPDRFGGCAKLAKDQSLPDRITNLEDWASEDVEYHTRQYMLKAGWRKVECEGDRK